MFASTITTLCRLIPNGCEVDLTIPEEFPPKALMDFIDAFINVCCNAILAYYKKLVMLFNVKLVAQPEHTVLVISGTPKCGHPEIRTSCLMDSFFVPMLYYFTHKIRTPL